MGTTKMRVYISGPITNNKDYFEKFKKTESELNKTGLEVINPADILFKMPRSTTHSEYMKVAIVLESLCDSVYMLKDWKQSKGAMIEYEFAVTHGMSIVFEEGYQR